MRRCRWIGMKSIGMALCLTAGCLRFTVPPPRPSRDFVLAAETAPSPPPDAASSDYLTSAGPKVRFDVQKTAAVETAPNPSRDKAPEKPADEPAQKPVETTEAEESSPPPAEPQPLRQAPAVPLTRPDPPSVQVLRALLDHLSDDEINERLKPFDPATRPAVLQLLTSVAQFEEGGGLPHLSPRKLAVWIDGLDALNASLRGRAQLILERLCFCSYIKNFGDFAPLPPEHAFFQPGEDTHLYVQVRNFSCRRQCHRYLTVMRGRLDIFDDNHREAPAITCISNPQHDVVAVPRQDYYVNFRFRVPSHCPSGLYTMRITVEDWTEAPPGAKEVPESRRAQRTIDFRVGGPLARPRRAASAEAMPSP